MPLSKYFGGKGEKVMANMKNRYGSAKGEEIFYATTNKKGKKSKKRRSSLRDQLAAMEK
jgi:hypothetical protein